jgi:ABC-2 type transport system permease protein
VELAQLLSLSSLAMDDKFIDASSFRRRSNLGLKGISVVLINEFSAFRKNLGFLYSAIVQPTLYYVFVVVGISTVSEGVEYYTETISFQKYAGVGIISILIVGQTSIAIYRATIDRRYGFLSLKFMSGVKPLSYIIGMSFYPVISLIIQLIILYFWAFAFGHISDFGNLPLLTTYSVLVLMFWSSLGIFITVFISNYQTRDLIIKLVITPLGFIAPVFFVQSKIPEIISFLCNFNPMTYQLRGLRSIAYSSFNNLLIILFPVVLSISMMLIVSILLSRSNLVTSEKS